MYQYLFKIIFLQIIVKIVKVDCKNYDIFSDIEIVGTKFFDTSNGEQFFLKGIAYQPQRSAKELLNSTLTFDTNYIDPLAETDICLRDIPYLIELGINTIRVYSIDPLKDHDICMEKLMDAGIYVVLDLSEPDVSIIRDNPTWDISLFERYKAVIDSMHKYPNVLGFFAGNEVTNDKSTTVASSFVKAAIRDSKKYISEMKYRKIPVGYSSNDDIETRDNIANYFVCGETVADFYGINMYEWCGYSSYTTSGYEERTEYFENYPIPIFFSEFGCNIDRPRPFTEVEELFREPMTNAWSGGLAYMYFEEENNYGVVNITDDGKRVIKLQDFENLKKHYHVVKPSKLSRDTYAKDLLTNNGNKIYKCPKISKNWLASYVLPPEPSKDNCDCLNELPCILIENDTNFPYDTYFEYICSKTDCSDIQNAPDEGAFGNFSFCSNQQKLSLIVSKIYLESKAKNPQCPLTNEGFIYNKKYKNKQDRKGKCGNVISTIKLGVSKHFSDSISPDANFKVNHDIDNKITPDNNKELTEVPKQNSASKTNYGATRKLLYILTSIMYFFF